ncbi:Abi-like protein [compost metagenome]
MRPFDKPALSVEQQLELLKQRGLQVANDDRAMRFLEVVTLFRLSPYMRPFQQQGPEHTFKPGSTLKAVVDIYRFDGSLRRISMDAIERVEVAMRATISNHMCPKYGPDWIADASVFSSSYSHDNLLRPLRDQLIRERNKLGREIDRIKKAVRLMKSSNSELKIARAITISDSTGRLMPIPSCRPPGLFWKNSALERYPHSSMP